MPAAPKWIPAAPALVLDPESGALNFSERQSITTIYNGKYADCVAAAIPKGTLGSGDLTGYYVANCRVQKSRGEIGRIVTVWEGAGALLPGDEWGLEPSDLNPATEKNPNFSLVSEQALERITSAVFTNGSDQAAVDRTWVLALGSSDAEVQAKKLYQLLRRGITNYYKPFFTYWWTLYSTTEPTVFDGGYTETPGGPLASTIAGLSLVSLRTADQLRFSGGIHSLTRKWLCASSGHWHADLYS